MCLGYCVVVGEWVGVLSRGLEGGVAYVCVCCESGLFV